MKKPTTALLLSGFILPGLGHIYLGQRNKGIVLILAVNIVLLAALFFIMKLASPVVAAHLTGTPLTPEMILENVEPYSFWAKLLLATLFAIWGFGLMDLISFIKTGKAAADN